MSDSLPRSIGGTRPEVSGLVSNEPKTKSFDI